MVSDFNAGRTAAAFLFPPLVSWPRIIKRHSYGVPERFVDNAGSWLAGNYLSVQYLLFADAAYRTTWIWKSCVLNGRKAFSRLFFRSKNRPFCCTFHLNQNQRENSLFTSEVHLFSIRCEGTKISGIFTNWCQLKARCSHEDFAAKRINRQYHW